MDTNKQFQQGYDAYFDCVALKDNPFCEETQPDYFDAWEEGWQRADADADVE